MSSMSPLRRVVFIALFAALFVLFSAIQIQFGVSPVPFTLQTMAVALAGAFLGPRDGFLSILLVYALAATGLPMIDGRGGLALFAGATAGFLWMFPICAFIIGLIVPRILQTIGARNKTLAFLLVLTVMEVVGSLLTYVGGIPWLMHVAGMSFEKAMVVGCYPYLLPDLLKNVVVAAAAIALRPYLPSLRLLRRKGSSAEPYARQA
ncbi:biotin transporter BioY [Paenibacillus pasadenensis]|uniref:biotin transporter BioY n=1 Tax=Paenibacillus pasadenensis TaxID=217090 RepID=UPI00203EA47D|nr:biotin transporter BioY [Paenibacillus pasadenensis]MCM3745927.1 biotin transporter BioY [Paenibacillus pasadenensis]